VRLTPLFAFEVASSSLGADFRQIRNHGRRISRTYRNSLSGDFFPPAFFCPHELERIGELGDGGKWVCGLSRLQEKEDCVVYSIGTLELPVISLRDTLIRPHTLPQALPQMLPLKLSCSRAPVTANFLSLTTLRRAFRPRSHPLRHCQVHSATFTPNGTHQITMTSLITGILGTQHSAPTSSRIASPVSTPTQ
jgi:hypothetical protein